MKYLLKASLHKVTVSMIVFIFICMNLSIAEANYPEPTFKRLAGKDRIRTAVEISKYGWPEGADTVVIVRDDNFQDALTGTSLASKFDAPILLTNKITLSPETDAELERLNPSQVFILGSTGAVSASIENRIKTKITHDVIRLGGKNRFETAVEIAHFLMEDSDPGQVIIANGMNFPDSLAISSWAGYNGVPILLTDKYNLPDATADFLDENYFDDTLVVGGPGVVHDSLLSELPSPTRISGKNRYETAININDELYTDVTKLYVATGDKFPDALAASALAARTGSAIVLIDKNVNEGKVLNFLYRNRVEFEKIHFIGSTGVISPQAENKIKDSINGNYLTDLIKPTMLSSWAYYPKELVVEGKRYTKNFFSDGSVEFVTFDLEGKFDKLKVMVGAQRPSDDWPVDGLIEADDRELWSDQIAPNDSPIILDLDVRGVHRLKFQGTTGFYVLNPKVTKDPDYIEQKKYVEAGRFLTELLEPLHQDFWIYINGERKLGNYSFDKNIYSDGTEESCVYSLKGKYKKLTFWAANFKYDIDELKVLADNEVVWSGDLRGEDLPTFVEIDLQGVNKLEFLMNSEIAVLNPRIQ